MAVGLLAGDIIPVVVALVALVMAYASSFLFRAVLARLWQWVPVFGQGALAWADGVINGAVASLSGWIEAAVAPLANVIAGPWQKVDHLFTQAEATFGAVASAIAGAESRVQAQVQGWVQATVSDQVSQLRTWTQAQIAQVTALTQWVHAAVDQDIHSWLDQAMARADQGIAQAQAAADQAMATAQQDAQALGQLRGQVGQLSPDVVGAMIGSAFDSLDTALKGGISGVAGTVGTLAADLAGVRAQAMATDQTLTQYLQECGQPLCDALHSPLQDLQGIANLADAGLILALLAGAVQDPQGTATLVQGTIGAGMAAIAGLFGLGGS